MVEHAIVFVFGSIVGSFLNVCIHRLPRGESIVHPPSRCPGCAKAIPWYDNIPIASFLLLGGRCRFCKARIRVRYLIVELATAALFVALYAFFGLSVKFFVSLVLTGLLIVATFVDFEHEEIPDEVSLGGLGLGLAAAVAFPQFMNETSRVMALMRSITGAAVGGVSIYAMGLVGKALFRKKLERLPEKEAMGLGDVKLMAMIGSFLGWEEALLVFFVAPFFGAMVGVVSKLKTGREIIPYGPYLSLAALIALLWGDAMLRLLFFRFW
jgi:leader peptidase (prepilin peptidase)/N-methyltransferase